MKVTTHGEYLIKLTRWWAINCFLVREDDGFTLVDTSMSGVADSILQAAQNAGGAIKRIAITHAHVDHIGSLDALRHRLPDAEVLASAQSARFMRGDMTLDPDQPQAPLRGGFPGCQTRPTRELADGDTVASLRVVVAPGHTPDHIAFVDTRDQTLIAGDAFATLGGIVVSGKLNWRFPMSPFVTWHKPTALATARALRALEPSRLAVGHGPVIEPPLAAMDRAIREAERAFAAR
jgi:glyoxylase-like metal-dependent hydrolase (beta-lactamase superfamily II)